MGSRKVLAIASGGGHWVQLLRLRPAFEGSETAYCSVREEYAQQVAGSRYYTVPDVSRRNPLASFRVAAAVLRILWRERPDVVVTTGAGPGFLAIVLAKLIGARSLWIDSIANCERLSTCGALARYVADGCVSQWPEVARDNGVDHWGSVL